MTQEQDELKEKNILVTGGAGFIASHIVDRLAPENNVFVLDNLFTGQMSNLERVKDRITFVEGDIRDRETVNEVV
ncbi:MAG: NAD-dependent epimerase/dehydratase family protein, partial [Dehalococcoidales bacterium]|nr:NAD-dependent epimerase/dehydratase family protein [Dehalococcoidales bacterium]